MLFPSSVACLYFPSAAIHRVRLAQMRSMHSHVVANVNAATAAQTQTQIRFDDEHRVRSELKLSTPAEHHGAIDSISDREILNEVTFINALLQNPIADHEKSNLRNRVIRWLAVRSVTRSAAELCFFEYLLRKYECL